MASEAYNQILASQKVQTRQIDYRAEVLKQWGPEWGKDEVVYKFKDGRKFLSTDRRTSGIYEPT